MSADDDVPPQPDLPASPSLAARVGLGLSVLSALVGAVLMAMSYSAEATPANLSLLSFDLGTPQGFHPILVGFAAAVTLPFTGVAFGLCVTSVAGPDRHTARAGLWTCAAYALLVAVVNVLAWS